jgi:3-dehydroquinate synthase
VGGGGDGYPVLVGQGALGTVAATLASRVPASRYALIADATVADLYGRALRSDLEAAGVAVSLFEFPAGERHKTRETWAELSDRMLEAGFGRDSAVVALGGGVTGDVAGFVAATFMRGLPVVQIPTSIVAMVDASVGGKTGVDVSAGKNLVGAFHAPAAVIVDPAVITTLERRQRVEGWVEGLKHGAILDAEYFEWLVREAEALAGGDPGVTEHAVRRSIEIKANVVAQDERETGLRQILNFGHTVGHAIEAAVGYELSHGVAVAMGMVIEAELGEALGFTEAGCADHLAKALRGFDIPLGLPDGLGWDELEPFLVSDKKSRAGEPRFVLIERIGSVYDDGGWSHPASRQLIEQVITSTRTRV